jgi:hypothetical protein
LRNIITGSGKSKISKLIKNKKVNNQRGDTMSFLPEGYTQPEKLQDFDNDGEFEVMKGRAVAELEKIEHEVGTWNDGAVKDLVALQWRLKTKVDGNCHANRVVFKSYYMTDGQYSTGAENRAKLANDLCTAGYDVDLSSEDAFYHSLITAVGITANLVLGEYNKKQTVKVVEKFSEKKSSKGSVDTEPENLPF